MKLTESQLRIHVVLSRLIHMCHNDADLAEEVCDDINDMLNYLHEDDTFGTEGQLDPRGDFRNGSWSMDRVEGVDK